jgi:hypothetical protein
MDFSNINNIFNSSNIVSKSIYDQSNVPKFMDDDDDDDDEIWESVK